MRILYYFWNENSYKDMIDTFELLGHRVDILDTPLTNHLTDENFSTVLTHALSLHHYDFIFTFNYFPVISDTAASCGIPYLCWVYDCPHFTLFSKSVCNACNYIFLFDRNMVEDVRSLGGKHVYHLPLAANTGRINSLLHINPEQTVHTNNYQHDISFVGSLYENNIYDRIHYLPEELTGYLEGIMASQKLIWGMDLITPLVDNGLCQALSSFIKLEDNSQLIDFPRLIYTNMLHSKITSEERITAVNRLSEHFPVTLYSGSPQHLCPNAGYGGYISYTNDMPRIFRDSKINLNITLRSITSGIPLRGIDILSCGGFLLSNYQPELAEYFVAGSEFVYFEDMDDLIEKADYYLTHEQERQEIAICGYKKANQLFSYEKQVEHMLQVFKQNQH